MIYKLTLSNTLFISRNLVQMNLRFFIFTVRKFYLSYLMSLWAPISRFSSVKRKFYIQKYIISYIYGHFNIIFLSELCCLDWFIALFFVDMFLFSIFSKSFLLRLVCTRLIWSLSLLTLFDFRDKQRVVLRHRSPLVSLASSRGYNKL